MQAWVISIAINFVLGRIAQFGETVDWDKVKADADARIQAVVYKPLQGMAVLIANRAVDACHGVLGDTGDLRSIADKVVAKDMSGAMDVLEDLLKKSSHASAGDALVGIDVLKATV